MKKNIPYTNTQKLVNYSAKNKWNTTLKKCCILLAFCFLISSEVFTQFTATWAFTSNASGVKAGTQAADITIANALIGSTFSTAGYSSNGVKCQPPSNWITVPTNGWHIDFPISPNGAVDLTLTGLTFIARLSGSSGSNILSLAYQADGAGDFTAFGTPQTTGSSSSSYNIDFGTLATTLPSGHTYIIRMYIYAVSSSTSASRSVSVKTAVFTGTSAPATVPTKLISFAAQQKNNSTILNWQTANEISMEKYIVERSVDATNYSALNSMKANNKNSNTYQFVDEKPRKGTNYYRLQMIEQNGKNNYSNIAVVTIANNGSISVFPNPVKNQLNISRTATNKLNETVYLTNIIGKKIMNIQLNSLQQTIDVSNLLKGIYILNFENGEKVKVVKE